MFPHLQRNSINFLSMNVNDFQLLVDLSLDNLSLDTLNL